MNLIACQTFRIRLVGNAPAAQVPIPEALIAELHLPFLTDSSPESIALDGYGRQIHACTDAVHESLGFSLISSLEKGLCLVKENLCITDDGKRLGSVAVFDYIVAFVHNFAEIIACGCSSVRLRVHVPFAVAVSTANIRLYCAALPRSSIVENGSLETGLEQFIRRSADSLAVPLAPVREAACGKFVGLNHLLGRGTVSSALLSVDGVVAPRGIVVVKAVGDVIGTAEEIL